MGRLVITLAFIRVEFEFLSSMSGKSLSLVFLWCLICADLIFRAFLLAAGLDSEVYLLHFLCALQCVSSNTHFYRDYLFCTHFWFQVLCFIQCWNVFHQNSVLISINAQSEFMSQDHSIFSVCGVMLAVWVAFSKIKCLIVYLICIR